MRVSRETCPRPSSSVLAAITMPFFSADALVVFACAFAETMRMGKTQSAVVGHAAKIAIVEHRVFFCRNICA